MTAEAVSPDRFDSAALESFRHALAEDGYFVIPGVVAKETLNELHRAVTTEFEESKKSGTLFNGGGQISGHLNCFPGEGSRRVYNELKTAGVIGLVRTLFPKATGEPNVGLNFNMPRSVAQHVHVDSTFVAQFVIINIAVVDTEIANGAIELVPRTQKRFYPYWKFAFERVGKTAIRVPMKQGDVLVRTSTLWHRGMPNLTNAPRPMMALTWEEGGSKRADPFLFNDGKISFHANWYRPNFLGRLRERIFVAAPFTYEAYRIARSLVGPKGYST